MRQCSVLPSILSILCFIAPAKAQVAIPENAHRSIEGSDAASVEEGDEKSADGAQWNAKSAAAYLDARAQWWQAWPRAARDHETFCVSCHTTLPYALSRAVLRNELRSASVNDATTSEPERALLQNVAKRVELWNGVQPFYPDGGGLPRAHQSRATEAILNALILSTYNSPSADAALKNMWALQIKSGDDAGAFPWLNFHNEPWEADDSPYFGAALASIAAGNRTGAEVELLRAYLRREFAHQTDINRAFALLGSAVADEQKKSAIAEILAKQLPDGGWSLASCIGTWKRRDNTAVPPTSDGYATALLTLALEKAGEPKTRVEIHKALDWLMRHQDKEGFWPSSSPNLNRDPASDAARFMSDAATGYAILALTYK
jgi:squalene-hopene/tetraprenyl-beta-curcumene cyclase